MTISFESLQKSHKILNCFFFICILTLFVISCHKNVFNGNNIYLNEHLNKEILNYRKNNRSNQSSHTNWNSPKNWRNKRTDNSIGGTVGTVGSVSISSICSSIIGSSSSSSGSSSSSSSSGIINSDEIIKVRVKNLKKNRLICFYKKKTNICFIYFNNANQQTNADKQEYNLSDDLKNIILLFGRLAEYYYPKTVEQFHTFKEPYSKYINTKINKKNVNEKWKTVFNLNTTFNSSINGHININSCSSSSSSSSSSNYNSSNRNINSNNIYENKINKTIFHEKICQLEFKWPINKNEDITESDYYNYLVEKSLNSIEIIKQNLNNLNFFLHKFVEDANNNKQVNKNTSFVDLYNELEKILVEKGKIEREGKREKKGEEKKENNGLNNNIEEGMEFPLHLLMINEQQQLEKFEQFEQFEQLQKLQKFEKFEKLQKLGKITMDCLFKENNRAQSRYLVNEIFSIDYPSKKVTDAFLHLVFQKNVEEFTFESFAKYLNILGNKMEIYNCSNNSDIHFDHFFVLMKTELQEGTCSKNGTNRETKFGTYNTSSRNGTGTRKTKNILYLRTETDKETKKETGNEKNVLGQLQDLNDENDRKFKQQIEQKKKKINKNEMVETVKDMDKKIYTTIKGETDNKNIETAVEQENTHNETVINKNKMFRKYILQNCYNIKNAFQKKILSIFKYILFIFFKKLL